MQEYLDLIIEEKWRKWYEVSTFIAAIEKLPIPKEKNIALNQGNEFITMYKNLFEDNSECWLKELLHISISGTPPTASTFARWQLGVTDPGKT